MGLSDFQISGQFLIKGNYHNSRASDDIDMKLGSVTKLDNRNKTTPGHIGTSGHIWRWGHIRKFWRHYYFSNLRLIRSNPEAGFRTHSLKNFYLIVTLKKLMFYLIVTLKLKTELKIPNTAPTILLWVKVLFWPKKSWYFAKKIPEVKYVCVLTCQI